jgi:homocysteine S-methyltransferase
VSGAGLAAALAAGPVVLDGGLSTELERAGHDLSSRLWSARLLSDAPEAVVRAHAAFLAAGAQVTTTASYQATFEGFAAAGIDRAGTVRLLRRSVELARRAADEVPGTWVAASVGPYGALLADGSEYTGGYADDLGVAGLRAFHRPRLEVLAEAGADVLACETVPSAREAEALLAELAVLGVPAWLSLTTVTTPEGAVLTRRGEPAAEVFAAAASVAAVVAVGVNCTDPSGAGAAVPVAASCGRPVVVYPNSGERWDAVARRWTGEPGLSAYDVRSWRDAGARLVGGCCRVGPAQLRSVAAALRAPDGAGRRVSDGPPP